MRKVFTILGMLILLVGSFFFDLYFHANPMWAVLPIYGMTIFLLLALAWVVLVDSPRSFKVAVIFIAVGLCGDLLMLPYSFRDIMFPSPPSRYPWMYPWANPLDLQAPLTLHTVGMILLIGLARLLPDKVFQHLTSGSIQAGSENEKYLLWR